MDNINEQDNKIKSKKRRKYITIFAIILLFICCILTVIELKNKNEIIDIEEGEKFSFFENTERNNIKQAKKNAKNYIKYKYGFTPKILSVVVEYDDSGIPVKTGYAKVDVQYKNEKFSVHIPSNRKSVNGTDNYQEEEIKKVIMQEIEKEIGKPYLCSVYCNYKGLVQDFYDGTNLIDIINNNDVKIELLYQKNVNLKKLENPDVDSIFATNANIIIGKFRENEIYDLECFYAGKEEYLLENARYLEEGFLNCPDEGINNKYYKFEMKEYDGLYFYAENINNLKIEKDDGFDWFYYIDKMVTDNNVYGIYPLNLYHVKLSDDYILSGIEGEVYVYCPAEKFVDLQYPNETIDLLCINSEGICLKNYFSKENDYYFSNINLTTGNNRISIYLR